MFKLSLPATCTPPSSRQTLKRACAGIALLGAGALWLWALPTLLARDGFVLRSDACTPASYRDPVTGQSRPAPSVHIAVSEACSTPATGDRR